MKTLRIAECSSQEQWDEFVRVHGTVHHLFGWAEVNRRAFGCRCVNLACYEGGEIAAIYPYIVRGRWPVRWFVSPNDFGGGPVGEPHAVTRLIEEVHHRAQQKGAGTNTARFGGETVPPDFEQLGYSVSERINLVIDISKSRDELLSSFSKNLRKAICKAESQGIEIRPGTTAGDLDDLIRLAAYHRGKIGYRGRKPAFIRAIVDCLETQLHLAYHDDCLVGGCLYLVHAGRVFGLYATRDPDQPNLRIGQALHWGGILRLREKGITRYDWLSRNNNVVHDGAPSVSPSMVSMHRFKKGWRPEEVPNYDAVRTFSNRTAQLRKVVARARNVALGTARKIQSSRLASSR